MATCKVSKNSTSAAARELYRYYVPTELITDRDRTPTASSDPILTSFAQLGALRLNAKRGYITLNTETSTYVLAESGQNLSLLKDDDEDDPLWHGVGLLKRQMGLGPGIHEPFKDPKTAPEYVYISDLSKDDRFREINSVKEHPHLRALLCVPLKTPAGLMIGKYIIFDDKPREEEICPAYVDFLKDMAFTVMDYLESGRMKRQQFRAERMVKALGLFIEGKSSLREWWLEHGHKYQNASAKKRHKDATSVEKLADAEFGVQETVDYFSRTGLKDLQVGTPPSSSIPASPSQSSSGPSQHGDRGDGRPSIPRSDTYASDTINLSGTTLVSRSWNERNSSVTTFETLNEVTPEAEKLPSVSFDLPPEDTPNENSRDNQNAALAADVKGVFARSSNLIREAIGVEGVLYFDASVGSFVGSSEKEEKAPGQFHVDKAGTSSEDEHARKLSDHEAEEIHCTEKSVECTEKYCNVLGFSTRKRSSLRGHAVPEEHRLMPEMVLRKLLKRYPHGRVFNFEEDGFFSSSESDNKPTVVVQKSKDPGEVQRRSKLSKEAEAAAILSVLPGARSVFWFPLWDQNRERWYAGSLVWSTCPTRTLCPIEDITYLAAFGNSTMAEISRLSAAVLSKMKTDFISSISHELRSPLHGVLASVEFLQETDMTEIQTDMVTNIHASGKVLLDTINHVLDFSKVNRKVKNKKMPRKKSKKGRRQSVDDSAEEKADICLLSEEVIESIYAGRSVGKKAFDSMGHRRQQSKEDKELPVTIIVDIQWRHNWTYEVDAGAWRRILMNLFNNAMKYTKTGFVKISMEIEEDVASARKTPRSNLTLKLKDSGKGISQEFLRHQLYKPFTQEDNLATGAGLGLSIVKAIIQDMGGRIDIHSESGSGTDVIVRIPLTSATPLRMEGLNTVNEVREKVNGLHFRLDGFERYPDISEAPTGILSADAEAAMLLKFAVQKSLAEWFGMENIVSSADGNAADVVVIMEAGLGDKSLENVLQSYPAGKEKAVAIVLTSRYHSGPKVDAHDNFRIFYLQQPYGPHKVAKILHQAFCQNLDQQVSSPGLEDSQRIAVFTPSTASGLDSGLLSPMSATYDFASIKPPTPSIPVKHFVPSNLEVHNPAPDVPEPAASKSSQPDTTPTANPLSILATIESSKPQPTVTVQEENGLRVLLVEDNEINLRLLIATMRKLKLDHVTATNGLEALNEYKESAGNFDVIFMDISMPVMSGIESTRHIRKFEKDNGLQPVALIALTGAANPSTRQEAFGVGVDLFLTKPVPMKALRGMLDDLRREGRGVFA